MKKDMLSLLRGLKEAFTNGGKEPLFASFYFFIFLTLHFLFDRFDNPERKREVRRKTEDKDVSKVKKHKTHVKPWPSSVLKQGYFSHPFNVLDQYGTPLFSLLNI